MMQKEQGIVDHQEPFLSDWWGPIEPEILSDNIKAQKGYLFCQLCGQEKQKKQMFSVVDQEDICGHLFCFKCLKLVLESCIVNNQDIFCPIDACPCKLNENSKFFLSLSVDIVTKYAIWKNSQQYKHRDQSVRYSVSLVLHESIIQQQQKRPYPSDINNSGALNLKNYDQQMLMPQLPNKNKKYPYTFGRFICKLVLVVFGLSLLLLEMMLLLFVVILYFGTILASIGLIVKSILTMDQQIKQPYIQYLIGGLVLSLIISIFLIAKFKTIYRNIYLPIWQCIVHTFKVIQMYPRPYIPK